MITLPLCVVCRIILFLSKNSRSRGLNGKCIRVCMCVVLMYVICFSLLVCHYVRQCECW
jgi:hypothetical protein